MNTFVKKVNQQLAGGWIVSISHQRLELREQSSNQWVSKDFFSMRHVIRGTKLIETEEAGLLKACRIAAVICYTSQTSKQRN